MINRSKLDLPLTFRAEVVSPIMAYLAAGNSCSLVGIGSVGKSNLLRFLQRPDVGQTYLQGEADLYLFVYVDGNKILKQSAWGLFELMLHQLWLELANQGREDPLLEQIDALYTTVTAPKTRHLALRYLDRAIRLVCNQLGLKVVFLFDEFDDLCRTLAPPAFAALRALRDEYKYRLMYVVATRLALKRLRPAVFEIEAFEELVAPHTLWLGPYTAQDAHFMLQRLSARYTEPLDKTIANQVLAATGRHPGLLREAHNAARQFGADFAAALATNLQVQDECQRLRLSLPADEQRAMANIANKVPLKADHSQALERLHAKKLVLQSDNGALQIFSSLFAHYIQQYADEAGAHITVDASRRTVWVDGRQISSLTRLEYELMAYLAQKRGQACSRDELIHYLYPEEANNPAKGISDNRIDSLVKRLRKRIEPQPKEPRYIMTVWGVGFCLQDGGDETGC